MKLLSLAFKSMANRRAAAMLTIATIGVSVALLLGVEQVRDSARRGFASTVAGTDLIVGARSGSINLLLYSVFHIGDATNNVTWQSYQDITAQPEVAWAVPLSLGDSHRGFRVVGTDADFFSRYHYGAQRALAFSDGVPFRDVYDAVIGAQVAEKLHYPVGQSIVLAHGTGPLTADHADKPFRVVGILARTGTPVDASVFVSLEAIEAIHLDWQSGVRLPGQAISADAARHADLTPKAITAFLLGLKSRTAVFAMQRYINDYEDEPLLAILPGVALQELWSLLGVAENALLIVAAMVVVAGLLGMLTALLTTLNERRREMAILRAVGARPSLIFFLLVAEAEFLTLFGIVAGLALLAIAVAVARAWAQAHYGMTFDIASPSAAQGLLLACVAVAGGLIGCLPAWFAYRYTLADGLVQRL